MSTRTIEAGRAFLKLLVDNKEFAKGVDASIAKLDAFGRSAQVLGAKLGAVGAAITAPFAIAVTKFTSLGAELDDMSARTGASVERLSELKFAAEQSGTGIKSVEAAYKRMSKAIGAADRGVASSVRAFDAIGLSVHDLIGLRPDEQFNRIARALNGIVDPTKKSELAMKLLGSNALVPLIRDMDELTKKARETGRVMTADMAKSAADLDDALAALRSSSEAVVVQVGGALAPAITKAAQAVDAAMPAIIEWVKQNNELILVLAEVGVGLQVLAVALGTVGTAYRGAAAALSLFKKAAILNALPAPVKIAAGVAAGGAITAEIYGRMFPPEQLSTAQQIEEVQKAIASDKGYIAAFEKSTLEHERMALEVARQSLARHEKELAILRERRKLETAKPLPVVQPRNPAFEDNRPALPVVQPRLPGDLATQREQERLREQKQRELERQAGEVASLRDNILNQVDSATRGFRGGSGGRFAEQIAGGSRSDDIEQRMLKIEEKMEGHLAAVVGLLRRANPLMIENK